MNISYIVPIILSGGSGSRLWPLSRESYPKQYQNLFSDDNYSLLQQTYKRISKLENICDPIIVCNEEHRFIVAEQMKEINVNPLSILLEPFGRNTAPAIALAAMKSIQKYEDPTLLVLSSDHYIKKEKDFLKALNIGIKSAENKNLVTFGVVPTYPEVGFGYIEAYPIKSKENIQSFKIKRFLEKPDLETAKKLLKDKNYFWNSGIFVFKAKNVLEEINKYSQGIFNTCKKALDESKIDLDFQRINKKHFKNCPNEPFDIAVLEKTKQGSVIPLNVGWSDVGSWESVWDNSEKDAQGNINKGNSIIQSCENSYIRSEDRLVIGLGLKNTIVIETRDAVLVAEKSKTQEIKKIVNELRNKGLPESSKHKQIFRPWGNYLSIDEDQRWQLKLINVKPGHSLSLQKHFHRAEHWIVVSGTAKIELDDKELFLYENQSTFIPLGSKHRLSNPGKIPLALIEIQSGAYLGEDDIERFADNYGRLNKNS